MRKAIYLRVSKDDLDESTQLPKILETFNLKEKDCLIFRERISAYQEDKQANREEFLKLKELIGQNKIDEIYVYSLERFERNLKRLLEFYFYCEVNECTMYSALQPYLNNLLPKAVDQQLTKNPIYQFLKYLMVLIYGFLAENESWFTSQRTMKSVKRVAGTTLSKNDNKWGRPFKATKKHPNRNEKGNVSLTAEEHTKLEKFINTRIKFYKDNNVIGIIPNIIEDVQNKFNLIIGKDYLYDNYEVKQK